MLVEYSENSAPEAFECAARDLVRLDKADAWARRELAVALCRLRRLDEALAEAEEATRIEPNNTFSHSVLGHVHLRRAELTEARARFQRAVELSVDNGDAIHSLLDLAANDKQRRDELAFVENELIRQVVLGDGLLAFIELASPLLEPEKLLSSLRHAHRERPDLWHAWSALISQLGHLGQLDEARELAREAVAKFPHLPRVWLDLAMVCQWRKEPEEEIKAAEHAFEMNPAWSRATLALAGVLERSGRMEEARKIYERALRHSPEEAELHASHGHLLWRLRQPEAALKAVEHALRLAPGCDWAWELLMDWAATCGTPDRPAQFARTLSSERPGEVKVWLMLARVLTDPASAAERLGATDRALELEPRCTEAWDLKAEFLAQAERFAESIQACEAGANTCTADLYVLQGRRAWIEARRRQFPEAVRRMRLVLEENASYLWGWNQLTHWLLEQNQTAEAASALEQLLRLRPRDPWVHRQLGFLRQKQDDRAGAQQAFANTLQLCPTDAFAAQNLFDSQLEAGDLDAAASTLEVMQTHQPGDRTAAAEVFLNLRRRNWATAKAGFEQLCASPDPDAWPVASVTDAFKQAGRAQEAVDVLQHGLRQPSINPEVAAALIRLLLDADRNVAAVFRFLKLNDGEVQLRAAAPLVQGLVRNKQKVLLRFLLWRRSQVLASDDAAWGQVGYALSTFNRMAAVADWLSDWRGRDKVEPWMLFNLCLAFRELGRYEEATRLARHVLKEWGHREGSADLRLFLAVEAALTGEVKEAREQLREAVIRKDVDYDRELLTMAEAVAEFLETPPSERRLRFRTTRQTLSERFTAWGALRAMKDVRRTFRRSGEIIAREGGGWQARSWFWWKLNWHWVVLPMLIPLFLGAAFKAPLLFVVLLWGSVRAIRRC
jgi:tetratricopeptide (TPR) repeat protein